MDRDAHAGRALNQGAVLGSKLNQSMRGIGEWHYPKRAVH